MSSLKRRKRIRREDGGTVREITEGRKDGDLFLSSVRLLKRGGSESIRELEIGGELKLAQFLS